MSDASQRKLIMIAACFYAPTGYMPLPRVPTRNRVFRGRRAVRERRRRPSQAQMGGVRFLCARPRERGGEDVWGEL